MFSKPIPVMKPVLPTFDQYEKYLLQIDQAGIYSNRGPLVRRLEKRYAEKLGVSNPDVVVLCANATLGLQGFMQLSEIPTWRVQSFTFPATVHAAVQSGKRVVLEDIDPSTWMISPHVIQDTTKEGIVPVLLFGAGLDAAVYSHLDHVLVDAAASIGGAAAWINDLRDSWAAVFSLHATKSFGIGEGGLVVFGSKEMASEFRAWINFGFSGSRESLRLGTNAKLSEVQAAVGLAVIDNWSVEEAEWRSVRLLADEISENLGLGQFDIIPEGTLSPYWIISHSNHEVILRIQLKCLEKKIETRKWWSDGCHSMPAFSSSHCSKNSFEETQRLAKRYLGLPLHRNTSLQELGRITDAIVSSPRQ
jgi:dTDP-4-amino-4,6-dideoxygalactose transaminase